MRKPESPAPAFAALQNKNVAKFREMNAFVLRHRQGFWLYFRRELNQKFSSQGRSRCQLLLKSCRP